MKKYHYIELIKGQAYLLYDATISKDFFDTKSIIAIGDERTVKNEIKKLSGDCVFMYYQLKDVKLAKDGSIFQLDFKKYLTKNFTEYKPEEKTK